MLALIEAGKKEGAKLKCGGGKLTGTENGYFVQQTVFADVTDDMTIAKDEVREMIFFFFPNTFQITTVIKSFGNY